jgi:hypothetical protein
MPEATDEPIACATYTHARRHPMVLGDIGGWTPPFKLTMTQIVVLTVAWGIEALTWRWWSPALPAPLRVTFALVLPAVLAWLTRRARIEGRSLPRFVLGWLWCRVLSASDRVGGRPYRPARPSVPLGHPIHVTAGPDAP